MVETIAPVVYGKRRDYLMAVALHVLGATIAAALLGATLGVIGDALGAPWGRAGYAIVAIVAAAYFAREIFGLPLPLFDRRRQVPEWWRTFFSKRVAAFLYGLGLGVGFLTFLSFGTFVAVSVIALSSGDVVAGALIAAPFGVARGLSVLVSARAYDEDDPAEVVAKVQSWATSRLPRALNGVAIAAIALISTAVLIT